MFNEVRSLCGDVQGLMQSGTLSGFYGARAEQAEKEIGEAELAIVNLSAFRERFFKKVEELHLNSGRRFAVLRELIEWIEHDKADQWNIFVNSVLPEYLGKSKDDVNGNQESNANKRKITIQQRIEKAGE